MNLTKKLKLISIFAALSFLSVHQNALADPYESDGNGGYYLTLDSQLYDGEINKESFESNAGFESIFSIDLINGVIPQTDVDLYMFVGINSNFISESTRRNLAFCTVQDDIGCLIVRGYANKDNCKWVKSIEIKWGNINVYKYGAGVNIYGNNESGYSENYLTLSEDTKITTLVPTTDNDGVSLYTFDNPVKYIALLRYNNELLGANATCFEYIKIHFADPSYIGDDPVPTVKMGASDEVDVPWSNKGINLDGFVHIDNDKSAEELGLKFYITPDFDGKAKPEPKENSKPEDHGMTGYDWYLFHLFESNPDMAYDGYWDSSEKRLECSYKNDVLNIPAPCSGRYKLSVETSEGVEIISNPVTLNIWPNTSNSYEWLGEKYSNIGKDLQYLSINSVPLGQLEGSEGFAYPYDENGEVLSKDQLFIFIPGLYDAKVYYRLDYSNPSYDKEYNVMPSNIAATSADEAPESYTLYSTESMPNLSELSETNNATLHLRIAKNGAMTPELQGGSENQYTIALISGTELPTPTGINAVEMEDGNNSEVIYYTIDGHRVGKNNLAPGLYIRSNGRKNQKILIKH